MGSACCKTQKEVGGEQARDGGEWCGRPRQQIPRNIKMDGKTNRVVWTKKNIEFLRLTNFKLLRQTEGKSINNCDFLKFAISVMGGAKREPGYAAACNHAHLTHASNICQGKESEIPRLLLSVSKKKKSSNSSTQCTVFNKWNAAQHSVIIIQFPRSHKEFHL